MSVPTSWADFDPPDYLREDYLIEIADYYEVPVEEVTDQLIQRYERLETEG